MADLLRIKLTLFSYGVSLIYYVCIPFLKCLMVSASHPLLLTCYRNNATGWSATLSTGLSTCYNARGFRKYNNTCRPH